MTDSDDGEMVFKDSGDYIETNLITEDDIKSYRVHVAESEGLKGAPLESALLAADLAKIIKKRKKFKKHVVEVEEREQSIEKLKERLKKSPSKERVDDRSRDRKSPKKTKSSSSKRSSSRKRSKSPKDSRNIKGDKSRSKSPDKDKSSSSKRRSSSRKRSKSPKESRNIKGDKSRSKSPDKDKKKKKMHESKDDSTNKNKTSEDCNDNAEASQSKEDCKAETYIVKEEYIEKSPSQEKSGQKCKDKTNSEERFSQSPDSKSEIKVKKSKHKSRSKSHEGRSKHKSRSKSHERKSKRRSRSKKRSRSRSRSTKRKYSSHRHRIHSSSRHGRSWSRSGKSSRSRPGTRRSRSRRRSRSKPRSKSPKRSESKRRSRSKKRSASESPKKGESSVTDFVKVCETVRHGPELSEAKPLERRRRRSRSRSHGRRSRSRSKGPRALPESESSKFLAIEGKEAQMAVALPPSATPSLGLCTIDRDKLESLAAQMFPVSCGSEHKTVEAEREENPEGNSEHLDLEAKLPSMSEIMQMRIDANAKLLRNANDNEAKKKLIEATNLMNKWAKSGSSATTGKYTGLPLKIPMTKDEVDCSHPATWARKDQFKDLKPIKESPGMALMKALGWNEGEGLGKDSKGNVNPLVISVKTDKRGLINDNVESLRSAKKTADQNLSGSNWIVRIVNGKHPVSALGELHQAIGKVCPEYIEERMAKGGNFRVKSRTAWGEFVGPDGFPTKKEAKSRAAYFALQEIIKKEADKYGMAPPVEACDSSYQAVAWIPTNNVPKSAAMAVGYKHFTTGGGAAEKVEAPAYFKQTDLPADDDRVHLNPDLIPINLSRVRPPTSLTNLMSSIRNPGLRFAVQGPRGLIGSASSPRALVGARVPIRHLVPRSGVTKPTGGRPLPLMQGIANWLGQQTRIRGAMVRATLPPGTKLERHPLPPGMKLERHPLSPGMKIERHPLPPGTKIERHPIPPGMKLDGRHVLPPGTIIERHTLPPSTKSAGQPPTSRAFILTPVERPRPPSAERDFRSHPERPYPPQYEIPPNME